MRKIILFFVLSVTLVKGYCQKETDIISPAYTKSDEITKSRRALLDKFLEKDRIGIILEMDRLMMLDDKDYLTLYPLEFWLLSYWLQDYKPILSSVKERDTDSLYNSGTIKIPPQRDYLTVKLLEKSKEERDEILSRLKEAELSEEEKHFLSMHLDYLLLDNVDRGIDQEKLNQLAGAFLNDYPGSEFADFTKKFIRVKYAVSEDGYILSFFSGKFLFTGNLTDYYKRPTLAGLSFEGFKNSWVYQLNLTLGFCKTKKDMPVKNDIWPRGSKALGGNVDLAIGRQIVNNKVFIVTPLAGIGIFGLDPNTNTNKEPEYKGGGIKTNIAGRIGVVADIKLSAEELPAGGFYHYYMSSTIPSIRIGYDYVLSPLKNSFIDYSGMVHRIIVGVGISQRKVKRVY
jgi:hypothetical protein